ncbi:ABC transporter permease [uncultured Microbulbifer sp.]|uniref:ABC transporter permease n=1 Tax=uncultured Microbulbifer sp. TaxID=348147 RepID=UPI002613F980|nr:ABC transporter permease [uncultured Microbulbifer sp.]
MNKVFTIAWREYRVRVTSPLYVALTLVMVALLVGVPILVSMVVASDALEPVDLYVVDKGGWVSSQLQEQRNSAKADQVPLLNLRLREASPVRFETLLKQAEVGEIAGILLLEGQGAEDFSATFFSSSAVSLAQLKAELQQPLNQVVRRAALAEHNLEPAALQQFLSPLQVHYTHLGRSDGAEKSNGLVFIAGVFNLLMYSAILLYASMTFQGVLEEKSSRVMEVMVAAVKPVYLITGKIIGIGCVGLTQMAIWVLPYAVLISLPLGQVTDALNSLEWYVFALMFTYFLLGYFLYSSIYAAVASTISRIEDSQAVMAPLTITVLLGYMVALFAFFNPEGDMATAASIFPLFSPTVMLMRLILGDPPTWQIALSLLFLLIATLLVVWASGWIYGKGVLRYGARLRLRSLLASSEGNAADGKQVRIES